MEGTMDNDSKYACQCQIFEKLRTEMMKDEKLEYMKGYTERGKCQPSRSYRQATAT